MDNNEHKSNEKYDSVLSTIQAIKDGRLNPKVLSEIERRECVEVLSGEGLTQPQIAEILKISDRTVRRDLEAIDYRNELNPDVSLAKRIIGNMFQKAMAHHRYLMRLARNANGGISEKSQAEFLAWRVLKEMVEKMQSLGYLPMRPQEISGDLFHHFDDSGEEKGFDDLKKSLTIIETNARDAGTFDAQTEEKIKLLKSKIEKAEIESAVNKLTNQANKQEGGSHETEKN